MLLFTNAIAASWIREWKGKIKRHMTVDGATVYVFTDRVEQRKMLDAGVDAFAIGESIFVRTKSLITRELLAHELKHVEQSRTIPFFPLRYLWETWNKGYYKNRYERQARYAAKRART